MTATKIYQPLAGLMAERLGWQDRALCRGQNPEIWFPLQGDGCITAKAICNACPVMAECREYALANRENYGVWGGMSVIERAETWRGRPVEPSDGRGGPLCCRLTTQQQTEVLDLLRQGHAIKRVARDYQVDQGVIRRLRNRHLGKAAA